MGHSAPVEMVVASLHRYPVKSMLGEAVSSVHIGASGADGDRRLALIDVETGHVASAKQPRKWAGLLRLAARADAGRVVIGTPDGSDVPVDAPGIHDLLSESVGRAVKLTGHHHRGATLEQVRTEALRYRPNLVLATPPGYPPYAENDWVGGELAIGGLRLRVLKPTHRCVVPTLEHGRLATAPHALRTLTAQNRVAGAGSRPLPCAGVYLDVLTPAVVSVGDRAIQF